MSYTAENSPELGAIEAGRRRQVVVRAFMGKVNLAVMNQGERMRLGAAVDQANQAEHKMRIDTSTAIDTRNREDLARITAAQAARTTAETAAGITPDQVVDLNQETAAPVVDSVQSDMDSEVQTLGSQLDQARARVEEIHSNA